MCLLELLVRWRVTQRICGKMRRKRGTFLSRANARLPNEFIGGWIRDWMTALQAYWLFLLTAQ